MFTTEQTLNADKHNNSSLSPKRSNSDLLDNATGRITPFRQDAKQYMDKVLHLMTIINQVDDLTNVAELKNQLQMRNIRILKVRAERDEY